MSNLKEIIRECVLDGIPVGIVSCPQSVDGLAYQVTGFAKSGSANVYENSGGAIEVHLRYDNFEYIETFEDLALICKKWVIDYEDSGYTSGSWQSTFERFGWVKTEVVTTTKSTWA